MSNPTTSLVPLVARVVWMIAGPFALLLLAFNIVQTGTSWLTAVDFAFFVVLAIVILCRWVEFRGGNAQTATGEPATGADVQRFSVAAGAIGIGAWMVANILGVHVLSR